MKLTQLQTKLLFVLSTLFLWSCCPKGGVDRSFTVQQFSVAVDYYSQGEPIQAQLVPKSDTAVEIFDAENQSAKHLRVEYEDKVPNRVIYYFSESWTPEKLKTLNLKYGNFQYSNVDFNMIAKTEYLREAMPLKTYYKLPIQSKLLQQVECFAQAVASLVVSRAHALSCPTSESSMVSFRPGTLLELHLN
ncbi:hypothetical protein K2P97_04190 [bacterium]|nr:hypothetical protein [bacterium]